MTTLNLTSEQKAYLLTELQSKIKEIIAKEVEPVEQFDEDGDVYEEDFYVGSSLNLEVNLNCLIIETILK
jgi:hypothetical protein|tara:strand:+ start:1306 stop:1515 length:210 start_codon:yes stop_codon:yes gene_type:complete